MRPVTLRDDICTWSLSGAPLVAFQDNLLSIPRHCW